MRLLDARSAGILKLLSIELRYLIIYFFANVLCSYTVDTLRKNEHYFKIKKVSDSKFIIFALVFTKKKEN